MTEYWLQKKTLGGWSVVTWYNDLNQAQENYKKCLSNTGYSWRLVKVEPMQEHLLNDEREIEPPELEQPKAKANVWAGQSSGWGNTPSVSFSTSEHGMIGKVWLVHHLLKQRKRVSPDEVEKHLANGFERGGPKTAFRE